MSNMASTEAQGKRKRSISDEAGPAPSSTTTPAPSKSISHHVFFFLLIPNGSSFCQPLSIPAGIVVI
jgi:hypothetical protein